MVTSIWNEFIFELFLDQAILTILENEARWAIRNKLTDGKKVPNYLNFIYFDTLEAVKPKGVNIIR
jgi:NitT/TauT family transport system substrate-binding protein